MQIIFCVTKLFRLSRCECIIGRANGVWDLIITMYRIDVLSKWMRDLWQCSACDHVSVLLLNGNVNVLALSSVMLFLTFYLLHVRLSFVMFFLFFHIFNYVVWISIYWIHWPNRPNSIKTWNLFCTEFLIV